MRKLSFLDRVVEELDCYKKFTKATVASLRQSPSLKIEGKYLLNQDEIKHSAGLMRVDYTGEICAQGLYRGQASVARSAETKAHLYHAAEEEYDHLSWCGERLEERCSSARTSSELCALRAQRWPLGTGCLHSST